MLISLRVIHLQNQEFLFVSFFRVGIHVLEVLDALLLLSYSMIGHGM